MKFASIGSWMDRKIEGAQKSWRGSEAKKTINRVMEKSRQTTQNVTDRVSISVAETRENFSTNLDRISKENKGKGFFKKAVEVGKQGGFIGLMLEKAEETKPGNTKPADAHQGWNIAK
ncbi:MAG: hypothetical protein K8T10_11330 [Candidatus Eremiobacteraeota bacterium]|nr:hypothetical protein [Candidatus Eremiobacteraeota bacterium]